MVVCLGLKPSDYKLRPVEVDPMGDGTTTTSDESYSLAPQGKVQHNTRYGTVFGSGRNPSVTRWNCLHANDVYRNLWRSPTPGDGSDDILDRPRTFPGDRKPFVDLKQFVKVRVPESTLNTPVSWISSWVTLDPKEVLEPVQCIWQTQSQRDGRFETSRY